MAALLQGETRIRDVLDEGNQQVGIRKYALH